MRQCERHPSERQGSCETHLLGPPASTGPLMRMRVGGAAPPSSSRWTVAFSSASLPPRASTMALPESMAVRVLTVLSSSAMA
jgi:hypothetical protein